MRVLLFTLAFATVPAGCTGGESVDPPVVGIRNMYNQPRYDTQERQPFFADQRSMRPAVEGAVSREMDIGLAWATGRSAAGDAWLMEVPPQIVERNGGSGTFLSRGEDRYDIYCAPCHSVSGDGKGISLQAFTTTDCVTSRTVSSSRPSATAFGTCPRTRTICPATTDGRSSTTFARCS